MRKKILILYAPLGEGHGSAAKALEEAFLFKHPEFEIKTVDVLDFTPLPLKKTIPWAFIYTTANVPFIYKLIYLFSNGRLRHQSLNAFSDIILQKSKFVNFIKDFNPDFIISTNPLPMQMVSKTKEKNIIDIPSANVCTDFGFHSFWFNKDVNYYFVATEEIKKALVSHGVQEEKVKITGIPIKQKFSQQADRNKILKELNLDPLKPVLLIVGGKISCKKVVKIIGQLKEKNKNIQYIVVAGRDDTLKAKLENSEIKNSPGVKIFGFVNNLNQYMDASDLILTKAGGITVAEAVSKGLPMAINDIIPGQEEDNVNYLVKNKAGVDVRHFRNYASIILNLFSNPQLLDEMKQNCKKLAKLKAAENLADFVAGILEIK